MIFKSRIPIGHDRLFFHEFRSPRRCHSLVRFLAFPPSPWCVAWRFISYALTTGLTMAGLTRLRCPMSAALIIINQEGLSEHT